MTTNAMTKTTVSLEHLSSEQKKALAPRLCSFLDLISTATGRGTFYNSKEEERVAIEKTHQDLFGIDRGVYAISLLLPGTNDYSRQVGFARLLDNPRNETPAVLTTEQEAKVLTHLCRALPPQRLLKLFVTFTGVKGGHRINNARTRKLILRSLLDNSSLEFWAVKYRNKMFTCLQHAWGSRLTGTLKKILGKPAASRTDREEQILKDNIDHWVAFGLGEGYSAKSRAPVYECVSFILGNEENMKLDRLKSFVAAKQDIKAGNLLPPEVLEGIRGRFHKATPKSEVLKLTQAQMTSGQRITMQRVAKEANVEVEMNPLDYEAIKLYVYAYEMGMTKEIEKALDQKAKRAAEGMPVRYDKIGILIDASQSMFGSDTQKLRPMAVALATRDMLEAASQKATVMCVGGKEDGKLVHPCGYTSLASGLVKMLKKGVDAVFVITDGYENAPAGRFDEVVRLAKSIGVTTPIYQISPVASAEAQGLRSLSKDVAALPISKPEAIGMTLLRSMFEIDVEKGIHGLLGLTLPMLEHKGKKTERKEA